MSKYVLVTGGTGYIGSHTVVELVNKGFTPILLDNFHNSSPDVLKSIEKITDQKPIFYQGDCRNEEIYNKIFTAHKIDSVIHFAAYKSVNESVVEPLQYFDNNLISLIKLVEAMENHNVNQLIFSSSCTVYGNPETNTVKETTPFGIPMSPYGLTKKIGEEILYDVCHYKKNIKAIFLRYFNPVGAHPSALIGEAPQGIPNNLFPYITQTIVGVRKELSVFGNDYDTPDGTCIRDYIHVVDVASAHVAAIDYFDKNTDFHSAVFNIGTGKGNSILEIIRIFEQVTGKAIPWKFAPRRDGDVPEILAIVDKATEQLHWKANYSIEDAILHAWNWENRQTK